MSYNQEEEKIQDPLSDIFKTRRIPHGRSSRNNNNNNNNNNNAYSGGGKGKGSSSHKMFDPLRAVGVYDVIVGAAKNNKKRKGKKKDKEKFNKHDNYYNNNYGNKDNGQGEDSISSVTTSQLIIHGLTDDETGLLGSFNLVGGFGGVVNGVCVFAGSRKGVNGIVRQFEEEEEEEEVDEVGRGGSGVGDGDNDDDENVEELKAATEEEDDEDGDGSTHASQSSEEDDEDENDANEPTHPQTALELADEKLNNRAKAFEKNSFRNPKFWMRWKGHVKSSPVSMLSTSKLMTPSIPDDEDDVDSKQSENKKVESEEVETETNMGYIVFSGNDCSTFEGTISCDGLGWDNMRIKGYKVKRFAGGGWGRGWLDF